MDRHAVHIWLGAARTHERATLASETSRREDHRSPPGPPARSARTGRALSSPSCGEGDEEDGVPLSVIDGTCAKMIDTMLSLVLRTPERGPAGLPMAAEGRDLTFSDVLAEIERCVDGEMRSVGPSSSPPLSEVVLNSMFGGIGEEDVEFDVAFEVGGQVVREKRFETPCVDRRERGCSPSPAPASEDPRRGRFVPLSEIADVRMSVQSVVHRARQFVGDATLQYRRRREDSRTVCQKRHFRHSPYTRRTPTKTLRGCRHPQSSGAAREPWTCGTAPVPKASRAPTTSPSSLRWDIPGSLRGIGESTPAPVYVRPPSSDYLHYDSTASATGSNDPRTVLPTTTVVRGPNECISGSPGSFLPFHRLADANTLLHRGAALPFDETALSAGMGPVRPPFRHPVVLALRIDP